MTPSGGPMLVATRWSHHPGKRHPGSAAPPPHQSPLIRRFAFTYRPPPRVPEYISYVNLCRGSVPPNGLLTRTGGGRPTTPSLRLLTAVAVARSS
jgi:hypothetical protein